MLPIEAILETPPVDASAGDAIGTSREGRVLRAFALGAGPLHVTLVGGCHADEPVGPFLLRRLVAHLLTDPGSELVSAATLSIVPHANPDGEARNARWAGAGDLSFDKGFDLGAYLAHREREPPGDDVEFGFPRDERDDEARPENRAVAAFLRQRTRATGALDLHLSLHGMAFAAGPWFLLDRAWIDRTVDLRRELARRVRNLGYVPHDVERHGEKGFDRIERGFCTRPDAESMRRYFLERGDPETAAKFRPSSMELARELGADPLTAVSEMPLFVVEGAGETLEPSDPVMTRLRDEALPRLASAARDPDALRRALDASPVPVRPMPLGDQMRLQLELLDGGIRAVARERGKSR